MGRLIEGKSFYNKPYECAKSIHGNAQNIYKCIDGSRKTHKKYHYEVVE